MKRRKIGTISVAIGGALAVVALGVVPVLPAHAATTRSSTYSVVWKFRSAGLKQCFTFHATGTVNATTLAKKSVAGVTYYRVSKAWISNVTDSLAATRATATGCSTKAAPMETAYFAQAWADYPCSGRQDFTLTSFGCRDNGSPGEDPSRSGKLAAQTPAGPGAAVTRYASEVVYTLSRTSTSLSQPTRMCFEIGAWAAITTATKVGSDSDNWSSLAAPRATKQVCLTL
jgi:hypothetical protein